MSRIYFSDLLCIFFVHLGRQKAYTLTCGTRQLHPVTSFLKLIDYKDLSPEQLRRIPIKQIEFAGPPTIPYPNNDVKRIKITANTIPVSVFNTPQAHQQIRSFCILFPSLQNKVIHENSTIDTYGSHWTIF